MSIHRFSLLTDGSSDRALVPILEWLVRSHAPEITFSILWADLRRLRKPPRGLKERVEAALALYPCDVLFIHRDTEGEQRQARVAEIANALSQIDSEDFHSVHVIPVRMQEAWLLIDEQSIRLAAGNPNGAEPLDLPRVRRLETLPDPKQILYDALRTACGLTGRRLENFVAKEMKRSSVRVAELIEDYSPLLQLSAFDVLVV